MEAQNTDGVVGLTDGTYRIDFNRWTLVCFATACGVYNNRTYRRSFVPWVYMFVRTEHEYAYKTMFTTTVDFAAKYFDYTLTLKYGSQDHATYIANAYKAIWPGIGILNCYPHLSRKAYEKSGLLRDPTFYGNHVDKNIHELELARSPQQFLALAEECTKFWITKHEQEYASWLTTQYLGERWGTWFCTVAAPGVLPSQNPIESHHQSLKTVCVPSKHAATSVVCNDTLPSVLYLDCDKPIKSFSHFAEGPIIGEMVVHARIFVTEKNVFKKIDPDDEQKIQSFVVNTCEYAVRYNNATGQVVNATRAERYLDSKSGKLRKGSRVPDFQLYYLSLHEVQVLPPVYTSAFRLDLNPIIPTEQIRAIRSRYQCDCKGFWTSGWLCSHVLAAMSLMEEYDLKTAVLHLPTRKKSGGQRKVRNALQEDDMGYFAVSKLEKDLVKKPSMPIGWNITMPMECTGEGGAITRHNVPGQIEDWIDCEGPRGVF
ncbi:hypothetical protein PPTG_07897 [Phytophthora nicotianae INRA-310]|uniref:SWIM-type domain-containing protein n=1 Tax=Phytophthora nicotianae (strain INRA-310) TaxID=761204 RepID=W2QP40_PHYN3|nr:hypothetical protein PPTG_07897 [Phytophthora nicotianae INRA-310]ETN14264.1 hypothetical protein PPTG_07897 [Phytophthora nicotianae INRA-310]